MSVSDIAVLFNQVLRRKIIRWPLSLFLKKDPFLRKSYIRLALESLAYGKHSFNPIVGAAKLIINYLVNQMAKKYNVDKRDILEIFKKEHYIIGLESVLKGALWFGVNRPFTPGAPFLVVWDYTYRCNLRCKHCYINAGIIPRDELTLDEKRKALDILADAGVASIAYSGGEPLLGEGIFEMIKRTKDYGMHASMATNGTLLTKEVAEELARIGLDYIQISLDSVNPHIHDEFRGVQGAFNRTIKGIKNAMNAGITVEVAMTITKYNVDQVKEMLDFLKELGVPLFMHFNFIPTGRGKDIVQMDIDPDTREKILKYFVKKAKENFPVQAMSTAPQFARVSIQCSQLSNEVMIGGHFYQYKGDTKLIQIAEFIGGCGAGRAYISLEPNGDIQPCVFLPIKVGNILKDDFEELWRSNKVFNDLRNRDLLKGACANCPFKYVCGGCRARAYAYFGDYLAPDPGCIYNLEWWNRIVGKAALTARKIEVSH